MTCKEGERDEPGKVRGPVSSRPTCPSPTLERNIQFQHPHRMNGKTEVPRGKTH